MTAQRRRFPATIPSGGRGTATRRHLDEAGVSSAELVVIGTLVLSLIFGMVELAIWGHTRTMVQAAATEAVAAASGAGPLGSGGVGQASTAAAEQAAREMIGSAATIDSVTVSRDQQWVTATITVSGTSFLVPSLHVTEAAQAPVERYVPPAGG